MPTNENREGKNLNAFRAQQAGLIEENAENDDSTEQDRADGQTKTTEPAAFPWGMLGAAALFDLIGLIPVVNFITELLAGLIIGRWQKNYAPKLDPVLTFIVAKIIDVAFLGLLPSNIGVVIYAYIKKKALDTAQTPLGRYALNKISKN